MSNSKSSPDDGAGESQKRNLPSWMSSRGSGGKSDGEKPNGAGQSEEKNGKARVQGGESSTPGSKDSNFSKLLEGVVFVLSGFMNPERSTLRSQALDMGAKYQPDWNPNCTLLICAFQSTPKFRQVEADCGTIVSKEWIMECYDKKKLVDIEPYLMHAGKPWRKGSISHETTQDEKDLPPKKSYKQVEKGSKQKLHTVPTKDKEDTAKERFPPSLVKKWATDDFKETISWLESRDEKPAPSEIKHVAVEGILTCFQDAIDSLEQEQDMRKVTEQWTFVPHVVEELLKFEGSHNTSVSKVDLCKKAKSWKRIYEDELSRLDGSSSSRNVKRKVDGGGGTPGYDSDETLEMTAEEIDAAYKDDVPVVWMK